MASFSAQAPSGRLSPTELFVIGAAAGAGAKTVAAPLDRVRLLYQVSPQATFSVRGAAVLARDVMREAGLEGLWRGHTATLWKITPFAGVQFMVYDEAHSRLRVWLATRAQGSGVQPADILVPSGIMAGAAAAALATLVTYPQDVLRTRLVAHTGPLPAHRSYLAAVEDVLRREGLSAFYRGLQPTLLGVLPYGAISWGTFEMLKQQLRTHHGVDVDDDVPIVERLAAGSVSAALAQVVVYPLHVVRRRMQNTGSFADSSLRRQLFNQLDRDQSGDLSRAEVEPLARRLGVPAEELWRHMDMDKSGRVSFTEFRKYGALSTLLKIRMTEGSAAFFKGASLSWAKGPLTVGLALGLNDKLKAMVCRHHQLEEGDQYAPLPGRADNAAEATPGSEGTKKLRAIESLVCGGIAGATAKTVIAPGDRLKILFQTDPTRKYTARNVWRLGCSIVAGEGVRGLWRGHGATLLRVVPYSATSFATFEHYKAWVRRSTPSSSDVTVRFLAGAMAGTTATTLTYPLDVFRARFAARQGCQTQYDGYWRAMCDAIRGQGGLAALYSGLRPTLLGIVPYSGLSFCIFETLKSKLQERRGDAGGLRVHERMGAGALAGLLAQSATYPLDIVRRRMQVDPGAYRSELQTAQAIWQAEGARGFFKGLSMNWVKGPIAMSISYFANDLLRDHVLRRRWSAPSSLTWWDRSQPMRSRDGVSLAREPSMNAHK